MSRLVNILMVCAWLLSQVLVVSHSQAHTAMDHQHHSNLVSQTASDDSLHVHQQSDKQHSHGDKSASSDDGVPAKLPSAVDECCDIACQSATILNSSELAAPHETSPAFKFAVRSASCWSPGSINPPPNPAA